MFLDYRPSKLTFHLLCLCKSIQILYLLLGALLLHSVLIPIAHFRHNLNKRNLILLEFRAEVLDDFRVVGAFCNLLEHDVEVRSSLELHLVEDFDALDLRIAHDVLVDLLVTITDLHLHLLFVFVHRDRLHMRANEVLVTFEFNYRQE